MTLAKQMYPGQTDFFLNQYEGAVKRPFGYLLIDLKTTNQDNCRLRTNVLPSGFNQAGIRHWVYILTQNDSIRCQEVENQVHSLQDSEKVSLPFFSYSAVAFLGEKS